MNTGDTSPLATMASKAKAAETMLKQMANARRLLVLCALSQGEKNAGELADITDLSHSALSQHLAKLKAAGFVGATKHGQHVTYRLASPEVQALLSTLYLIFCHPSQR